MKKQEKQGLIDSLNKGLVNSDSVVVAYYRGLTVSQMDDLRSRAREAGISIKVFKNTLAKLALNGTKFEALKDSFKGPTLMAFGADIVSPSKILVNFAKENEKLEIIAGATTENVLDLQGIKNLASLPTLDEARAGIAQLLKASASKMAMVLDAYAKKTV